MTSAKGFLNNKSADMTSGNIVFHIISFSLPLIFGNIFQQLYNMVDTWVVGNFVSNEAYSAVGAVGPIINTLIGFFLGFSTGASVVISQYFGAARYDRVKKTVQTSILAILGFSVFITAVSIPLIPFMLKMMQTPTEVIPEATTYLKIYFAGITGLLVYNIGAGILRAVGDSQRPFVFLVVAAVINTVLDLLFVIKFNMGVAGVAYATIIAQAVSAVLIMIELMKTTTCVKFTIKDLSFDFLNFKQIIRVGLPTALQLSITSFSNVFVQAYINKLGADCMSGWTTYSKIDMLMYLPMQSIAIASTTFVGQNLGNNDETRARKGSNVSLITALISTAVLLVPIVLFAPQITAFFNAKPAVVESGTLLLRYIAPFYLIICVNQILAGTLRGAGNSKMPMYIMLGCFVIYRQIYLFFVTNYISNTLLSVAFGYPSAWILCSIIMYVYYKKVPLSKSRLVCE